MLWACIVVLHAALVTLPRTGEPKSINQSINQSISQCKHAYKFSKLCILCAVVAVLLQLSLNVLSGYFCVSLSG